MKNIEDYKVKMDYPQRPAKQMIKKNATPRDYRNHAIYLEHYECLLSEYKKNIQKYNKAECEMIEEFKKDLFEHCDVSSHPKAEQAFSIAWEKGHSYGLNSVRDEFEDIAVLLID